MKDAVTFCGSVEHRTFLPRHSPRTSSVLVQRNINMDPECQAALGVPSVQHYRHPGGRLKPFNLPAPPVATTCRPVADQQAKTPHRQQHFEPDESAVPWPSAPPLLHPEPDGGVSSSAVSCAGQHASSLAWWHWIASSSIHHPLPVPLTSLVGFRASTSSSSGGAFRGARITREF